MSTASPELFRDTIQHHSKSFAFASTLIPGDVRHHVEVLYTWCRHADDAIDLAPPGKHDEALASLRGELQTIYDRTASEDPTTLAMQDLVARYAIPPIYPQELLEGMAMDARGTDYTDTDTLLLYCYRVAGTVGLMMSHVLGVREPEALQNAVHLGIAMQLTNICRDVKEDWDRDRLYLPHDLLARHGAASLPAQLGNTLPISAQHALARTVEELLDLADVYYASADAGMKSLRWRAALAVRAARHIYAEIGTVLRKRDCDVFAGRAYVSKSRKYVLGLRALGEGAFETPYRTVNRFRRARLGNPLQFPQDVLLLDGRS
jgi:phytoene synthase